MVTRPKSRGGWPGRSQACVGANQTAEPMSSWGYVLMAVYLVVGLGRSRWAKADRIAVIATAVLIGYAIEHYGGL